MITWSGIIESAKIDLAQSEAEMKTVITLPDGYNGHTEKFFAIPIAIGQGQTSVKLACANPDKAYCIRWVSREEWAAKTGLSIDLEGVINPRFDEARMIHDWRNHIPDQIKDCWPGLSIQAKIVAYTMAEKQAEAEEWE